MKYLTLPECATHVDFSELAHLIADALWPSNGPNDARITYGAARLNLDSELLAAVRTGALPVKDPLTLGPHTFPHGNALLGAKVAIDDLQAFIEGRDIRIVFSDSDDGMMADDERGSPEYRAEYSRARRQLALDELAKVERQLGEIRAERTETRKEGEAKRQEIFQLEARIAELAQELAHWPATASNVSTSDKQIDWNMLATRNELVSAFGSFTGMNLSWFSNLRDRPKLMAARRIVGTGGKNKTEPLFCPFAVMEWLNSKPRQGDKRRAMSVETGWRMLERHFPTVYNTHSIADPRDKSTG